ncbi:MAG: histidine phosphatase family protein [Cryomorphaceae bacterium]|nr:histidine phosphatase family protein [Cryomorphaceae bacterium]
MERTLYLIRHAKSSWDDETQRDFDRVLNQRGLRDAPAMAKKHADSGTKIDLIISSPAMRAFTTSKFYAHAHGMDVEQIDLQESIYNAGVMQLLEVVKNIDDRHACVLLFGHNPGISTLVGLLSGESVSMPTNGVAELKMEIEHWKDADSYCAELLSFDYPKNHIELR